MNKTSSAIVRTLLLGTSCLSVFAVDTARAQPAGGTVALGTATITNSGSNSTVIDQKTGKLVINWNSFSIDAGGTVKFNQPGSSSIALNRILGADPTQIYGSLLANGQVWIINGNGVLFGQGSRINVGGLIATTADLDDSDFAAGNYDFSGGTGASVVNQGSIKTRSGGYAVLSGASASNQGLIAANAGSVAIGGSSAFTIDFDGDGLLEYSVSAPTGRATSGPTGASNSGTITAQRVVMTARAASDVQDAVVNNTGMISASSARVQDGEVILDGGDGDVNVGGTISATGTASGTTGGSVTVSGHNINVADNTQIDVSGNAGGGTVRIGGDLHGTGTLPNAANVTVGNATIKADATGHGNGGTVVVWSDGTTDFGGTVSARGAGSGGNGGLVETSGHNLVVAPQASVDTSAASGATGNWLLDPDYITIGTPANVRTDSSDLSSSGDPRGTQTIAPSTLTGSLATTDVTLEAKYDINVISDVVYTSAHALSLLAGGDVHVAANVQNAGMGAIAVIAGWDGTTTDPAHFTDSGVYGNGGGSVYVTSDFDLDPGDATEVSSEPGEVHPVSIGSAGGTTTVAGSSVSVLGYYALSQIGYAGAGGGDIVVRSTGNVELDGSWGFGSVIGNGSQGGSISGDVTGNIDVRAGGTLLFEGGNGSAPWIGNLAAVGSAEHGNVTMIADSGSTNGNADLDAMFAADVAGGDVTVGLTGDSFEVANLQYDSAHNVMFLSGGNLDVSGSVINDGTGAITLVGGWNGTTLDPAALKTTPNAFGNNGGTVTIGGANASGDVRVGSNGGPLTVLTGYLDVDALFGKAQLGYHGAGGGDITVTALNDIDLFGGSFDGTYFGAFIGNGGGSVTGAVTGNITLTAAGSLILETVPPSCSDCSDGAFAFIGNRNVANSGPVSGSVVLIAGDFNDSNDYTGGLGDSVTADLSYGDVTIGQTGSANAARLNDGFIYDSSHNLTVLSAGDIDIESDIENSGSGAITLVAGWDGHTLDPAHFGDAGVYGNTDGSITVGGASAAGNSSVGSSGGATNIFADDVTLSAVNGTAQIGYQGTGSGAVTVDALGTIALDGGADMAHFAQIGSGAVFGANTTSGDVTLTGGSIAADGFASVVADNLALTTNGGDIGASDAPLQVAVDAITVQTSGGSAYLTSPQSVAITSADMATGDFTLSAGGAITQTGTITSGSLNVSTTSGAITLTNAGNSFGGLTVSTTGSDNASFAHSSLLTVASANVGGTLTLTAGTSINQNGAIHAAALNATANNGTVVLTNAGNSFASLILSTTGSNDASVIDASAVTLGTSTVGGTLTLAAGGAISQSGALSSAGLNVSTTSGSITLTNAANAFGPLTVSTTGSDNASFTDTDVITVASANVGGTLTLTGPAIGQTGAIHAAALNATATGGTIVLTNAGNAFASLVLSTGGTNAANVSDSSAVSLGTSTVGGGLTLSAGGAITQSGALSSASLNVSTTSGAIALTNAANAFGPLTVSTEGSDNASFTSAGALTVASADVGGTLTLAAGGAITQTGAIAAGGLNASTTSGAITLTNAGNDFATLAVATASGNAATVNDAGPVALAASNVGGTFTLSAGGAITQTGALTSGALNVSTTSGAITLTNSANAFGPLTVSTTGSDNASFTNAGAVTVASANVGGTLTLAAGGAITQTGAVTSGGLNVSTTTGAITLTNAANAFGPLTVSTTGSDNASFTDTGLITVAGANVGGTLTLIGPSIGQTGAIQAAALNATATTGSIALGNAGNSFAALTLSTTGSNSASVTDATAVALNASTVGGALTIVAGGQVGQTGALTSGGLNVTTSAGGIALNNAANAVSGVVHFNTPGAATFADTLDTTVGGATVGGDFTLLSEGNVVFIGGVQSTTGAITVVAGWDGTTTDSTDFGNSGVYGNGGGAVTLNGVNNPVDVGSQSGATTVYASALNILGTNASAQLGYHGSGGGAITVRLLHDLTLTAGSGNALLGNGSVGNSVTGNITGDIDVRIGGEILFTDSETGEAWIGNIAHSGTETGNLILVMTDADGEHDRLGDIVGAEIGGGDVTLGFTGTDDQGPDKNYAYNSSHTLNLLTVGNLVIAGSVQNAGSGAINLVAGWDGHTLTPGSFASAGVSGNGGNGVIIGGADAAGGVAIGSAGGETSVYGASLTLTATNGYAQLGFNGQGSGGVLVDTTGAVTLTGGANAGDFAQIGNGGLKAGGDNSGDISITAGGDVVLAGGAGTEAYAQIGHGGAESNTAANGYSNTGAIGITADDLTMTGGTGQASYAEIGQGGYKSGLNLAGGQAVNSGTITVNVLHDVTLNGGGDDAFAQIGSGGSQSNLNAAAAAGGTDSGDIVVSAPNGPGGSVTSTAGGGANAYAQIGNGGYAVNSGPTTTVANFTVSGNITVTDLALTGGPGANGFSLIGNGDASLNSDGNISGNIQIDANGNITYTTGSGLGSQAAIGNFTGQGTVSGTIEGVTTPSEFGNDPGTIGVVVTNTANNNANGYNPITTINSVVVTGQEPEGGAATLSAHIEDNTPPGPLASLDDRNADSVSPNTSDSATVVIADSLDGAKKQAATQTILAGMLTQTAPTGGANSVHAIPPADQDFSSWGNEALWQ